jgi:hypothetical protein
MSLVRVLSNIKVAVLGGVEGSLLSVFRHNACAFQTRRVATGVTKRSGIDLVSAGVAKSEFGRDCR